MSHYLHYWHPTHTRGLTGGGFCVTDEAEGRHYLADYARMGYRAELWCGDELVASA